MKNNNYNPRPPVSDWFIKTLFIILAVAVGVRVACEILKALLQ